MLNSQCLFAKVSIVSKICDLIHAEKDVD